MHNDIDRPSSLQSKQISKQCDNLFSQDVIDYQRRVNQTISWLYEKDNELQNKPDRVALEVLSFDELLNEYSSHEKFLTDFYNYGSIIMKCKEDGFDLRDNDLLNQKDREEVGIQVDTMEVSYEKLKILSSDRLGTLKSVIEDKQTSRIRRFDEWLSVVEKKIGCYSSIGPDCNSIQKQLEDMDKFRLELEQKQHLLESMSDVIVFDDVDTESMHIRTTSCESLNQKFSDIDNRWKNICNFVNDRIDKLERAKGIWELLEGERPCLLTWLEKIQESISELTNAAISISDPRHQQTFHSKLLSRCKRLDNDIKAKETLYTSLEQRTRIEIDANDDKYSMFVVELEKALEEIQESWNSMMYSKRMLDYQLHSLNESEEIKCSNVSDPKNVQSQPSKNDVSPCHSSPETNVDFNHDKLDSVCQQTDFDTSSQIELGSQDAISTNSINGSFSLHSNLKDESIPNHVDARPNGINEKLSNDINQKGQVDHNCRVEEWRQSLESLSTWLRRIEAMLGIDETMLSIINDDSIKSWSQSDPHQQLLTIIDIEKQISSSCQDEFDCLILQGQLIIADLLPDENVYEDNLKEILSDIELRFHTMKRCLTSRKLELTNKTRWQDLCLRLKASSEILIEEMAKVVDDGLIGVDLITLAQQQDELIRAKSELDNNIVVQSTIQDANLFLRMCSTIQQHVGEADSGLDTSGPRSSLSSMWYILKDLKEEIEAQLDGHTLHLSELTQLIEDRLERLDEVHKEMHALQHSMQELSQQLQVAEIRRANWVSLKDLTVEQLSEQLEDLKLYKEKFSKATEKNKLMNSIIDWMTQCDVPLSDQNLNRTLELNTIYNVVYAATEDRQKSIELAFDNQSASEQRFLTQSISGLPQWERRVAASKVPYFVDHVHNITKWDHPRFTEMLESLESVKEVVFSAYRTALKLRLVQKFLKIDLMMLETLNGIISSFNFTNQTNGQSRTSLNSNETLVDVEQVILLLKIIYEKIREDEIPELDVPFAIDMMLNWLLNLFDVTRTGFVSLLSLKVGLILMCCATREEKYNLMYDLVANHRNGSVDGRRLGTLFEIWMRLPTYLGEAESFGDTEIIEISVRDCFSKSKFNPDQPNCIDRDDFANWLKGEPQFIIWLPVLHRLLVSENTRHLVKCKLCKEHPIVGLRYRCLKCFNFNVCQDCFLVGRHLKLHHDSASHPMQEYCCETKSGTNLKHFSRILKYKLKSS